jgi:hypothetical protein
MHVEEMCCYYSAGKYTLLAGTCDYKHAYTKAMGVVDLCPYIAHPKLNTKRKLVGDG